MAQLARPPLHRPGLPLRADRRRRRLPRHEVLPAAEPRDAGAGRADQRRGGAAHRHPARERRRDRPPGRHHPPRHQAGQRPRQPVRRTRPHRLRHRRPRRSGTPRSVDEDVGVSVPWSPPEVLYGQCNGDARSDVYSLAATLWHLLVGRSPFEQPGGDNSAYALMPRIRARARAADRSGRRARLRSSGCSPTPWPRTPRAAPADGARARAGAAGGRAGAAPAAHPDRRARRAGPHHALAEAARGSRPRAHRPRPHERARPALASARLRRPRRRRHALRPTSADRRRRRAADDQRRRSSSPSSACSCSAWSARWSWALGPRRHPDGASAVGRACARRPPAPQPGRRLPRAARHRRPGHRRAARSFTWHYVGVRGGRLLPAAGRRRARRPVVDAAVTTVRVMPRTPSAAEPASCVCAQVAVSRVGLAGAASASAARPPADRHPREGWDRHGSHRRVLRRGVRRAARRRPLTIGRVADVEIDDNPYLHRVFLQLHREHDLWWLINVGSTLTATVADKQGPLPGLAVAGRPDPARPRGVHRLVHRRPDDLRLRHHCSPTPLHLGRHRRPSSSPRTPPARRRSAGSR